MILFTVRCTQCNSTNTAKVWETCLSLYATVSGCTYKYAHMHTCTRTHTHHVNKMSGDSIYFRHSQTTGNPFKSCSQPLLKQKLSKVNVISKEVKAKYLAQDNYAHTWSQCRCKSSVEKEKRVSLSHFPNLLLLHVWRQAA